MVTTVSHPSIGLSEEGLNKAASVLATNLADEYLLRTKLRKYHWNVTGHQFRSLHELFESQYEALAVIIDKLAERLRTYGQLAPGTLQEFIDLSRLSEHPGENPDAHQMVQDLIDDHEAMVRCMRDDVKTAEDEISDVGLADLLTGYLQVHQDMSWMLRAYLVTEGL